MKKIFAFLIIMFIPFTSKSEDCPGLSIAKTLNTLLDVSRFHNCTFEVVKIESQKNEDETTPINLISYLVYGKDLFRCKTTDKCPEANYEITIKKECLNRTVNLSEIEQNSNGYNLDGRKMRNHMQIKFNLHKDPIQIAFGQTDLAEAKRINYVSCKLNPLSGN